MDKVQKELHLLKAYALFLTVLLAVSIFLAAKSPTKKVKFEEVDAERINIVEGDGKVRLTLANEQRMPGGQMAGVDFTSREGNRTMGPGNAPTAGLLFFNDDGDECGGLTYGSKIVDGKANAVGYLSFDQYRQNEAVAIMHSEGGGGSRSGLQVTDAGAPFTADFLRNYNEISQMKEGPDKAAVLRELTSKHAAELVFAQRLFVGHLAENDAAAVILMDKQSKPRIRMLVDAAGSPSLEFLVAHGKVTSSFPGRSTNGKGIPPV